MDPKKQQHESKKNIQKGVERLERHSGTGRNGGPKKGGGGGKHTWGSLRDDVDAGAGPVLDENDPNFDPEEMEESPKGHA